MKQKHFMDIENFREAETELRSGNGMGFIPGDLIQISEKWDGSNAAIAYDIDTDSLVAFSRRQELTFSNTLNGFWNYAKLLNKEAFKLHPTWRVFGEWGNKNKIVYNAENYKKWYVYDIFDIETNAWLPQTIVKQFCSENNLTYIHILYEGPFISWEHCKTFMNSPAYGDRQEGIVVKNQTRLNDPNTRMPFYLKIVNSDFKESMAVKVKVINPAEVAAEQAAFEIVKSIVTRNRIEKMLYKLRDEQILPENIEPKDMKTVAQNLPKRIYEDCIKEEKELVEACGDYFNKMCSSLVMKIAREIIFSII